MSSSRVTGPSTPQLHLLYRYMGRDAGLLNALPIDSVYMASQNMKDFDNFIAFKILMGHVPDDAGVQLEIWVFLSSPTKFDLPTKIHAYTKHPVTNTWEKVAFDDIFYNGKLRPEFEVIERPAMLSVVLRACFVLKARQLPPQMDFTPGFLRELTAACRKYSGETDNDQGFSQPGFDDASPTLLRLTARKTQQRGREDQQFKVSETSRPRTRLSTGALTHRSQLETILLPGDAGYEDDLNTSPYVQDKTSVNPASQPSRLTPSPQQLIIGQRENGHQSPVPGPKSLVVCLKYSEGASSPAGDSCEEEMESNISSPSQKSEYQPLFSSTLAIRPSSSPLSRPSSVQPTAAQTSKPAQKDVSDFLGMLDKSDELHDQNLELDKQMYKLDADWEVEQGAKRQLINTDIPMLHRQQLKELEARQLEEMRQEKSRQQERFRAEKAKYAESKDSYHKTRAALLARIDTVKQARRALTERMDEEKRKLPREQLLEFACDVHRTKRRRTNNE